MKQKLKIVFVLITFSLLGIIVFQAYWTISAYLVNKEKFDNNINIAMQKAMEDCKVDYIDSVRKVLVRRLSPSETTIKIDTLTMPEKMSLSNNWGHMRFEGPPLPPDVNIYFSNQYIKLNEPYRVNSSLIDFYKKKASHNATISSALAAMALDIPALREKVLLILGMYDLQERNFRNINFYKKNPHPTREMQLNFMHAPMHTVYDLPPNYKTADSLKLRTYYKSELKKIHINSPFDLRISAQKNNHFKSRLTYSETTEVVYDYHGFVHFKSVGERLFIHAVFRNPQFEILKSMLLPLLLSLLLIIFTIFCYGYIIRTFIAQKKLSELKDDFINNMTHELKTPIATMSVAIEGLEKFNALHDADKTQRYLQTSKNELQRLNQLVTKVLDIAAFENKEIQLNKELIPVDELVAEVVGSEQLKSAKPINITYINKEKIETIYADKTHFRNVLANILDNAVKYSNEPIAIVISSYKNDKHINFSIKDNGPGISSDQVKLIFDKFHRVPAGNIHTVKGTGLGLSYVKYIVKAHGGDVSVKSEINKGSEFIVSIPLGNG
ncbi:MAG: HAMP domain-containing histidine kinase [Bacteroidota bacterium]|nr:HAMP domain-containing histidine kinase [Bacteroidota bacterium]